MQLPPDVTCRRLIYDDHRAAAWQAMLSSEERARVQAFGAEKRRREFLLGRAAARTLLAERLRQVPGDVPLHVADDGAVDVTGHPLFVSITHSGDQAAAAVAGRRVGVDLGGITPRREGVARFLLHPEENGLLDRLSMDRTRALILCWTLKEAALKAQRTGLRRLPNRLRLKVDVPAQTGCIRDEQGRRWQAVFEEWDGAYLAVACPA